MNSSHSSSPVAVVTGGARGIGLAIGQWFLAHGYRVALLDINGGTLTQTATKLNDTEHVLAMQCNVSDPQQIYAAVERITATFGRIDALVNNGA